MNYTIERSFKLNKYEYKMVNSPACGQTIHTFGILLRKFDITTINNEKYILREKNVLYKILNYLPILKLSKFVLLKNDIRIGELCPKSILMLGYILHLNSDNETYEFFLDRDNNILVINEDITIACIHKETISYAEKNIYNFEANAGNEKLVNILFIITLFCDIIYFSNRCTWSGVKLQKTRRL